MTTLRTTTGIHRKFFQILLCALIASGAASSSIRADDSSDSLYYEVNKSLMVFGDLFRQVNSNYVDDVEPDEMLRRGLDGMLEYLDPYTTYISNDESDQVDMLTKGFYGGLGVTIAEINGETTVVDVAEGYAADEAGIRIGDKIYMIDSVVVLNSDHKELRQYTRGAAGSELTAHIIREGLGDTLVLNLKREKIQMRTVSYAGFLGGATGDGVTGEIDEGNIGYIKLDRFARGANAQFRQALDDLKHRKAMKGLIVDLRGNPGGLLDAAVSISEIFVPTGSQIVSTRGRSPLAGKEYVARGIPKEPELPLVILIDKGSASASEIFAAAIQDLDRGVLVGERSFGKGLVQTISSLPFEATLKMTTARYYTPSGRCIQRIKYEEQRTHHDDQAELAAEPHDSTIFYTQGGRPVYESNGIRPDVHVSSEPASEYVRDLKDGHMLFRFGTRYSARMRELPQDFHADSTALKQFAAFLEEEHFVHDQDILSAIEVLEEKFAADEDFSDFSPRMQILRDDLARLRTSMIERHADEVLAELDREISARFLTRAERIAAGLGDDPQVQTAVDILNDQERYGKILDLTVADGER